MGWIKVAVVGKNPCVIQTAVGQGLRLQRCVPRVLSDGSTHSVELQLSPDRNCVTSYFSVGLVRCNVLNRT